jgi:hypothetical protein
MAVALPMLVAATSLIAGGAGAYGSYQQGQAAAAASDYNAKVTERNAAQAGSAGAARVAALRSDGRQRLAEQLTGVGETGLLLSGSAMDLYAASARNIELDGLTASRDVELEARGLLSDASLRRFDASAHRAGARTALVAGLLGAGSQAATGYVNTRAALGRPIGGGGATAASLPSGPRSGTGGTAAPFRRAS